MCLPHPHEGGNLSVKHRGKTYEWDWDDKPTDTIQWAAFYSDCEHEVKEVRGGHVRVSGVVLFHLGSLRKQLTLNPVSACHFDLQSICARTPWRHLAAAQRNRGLESPIAPDRSKGIGFAIIHGKRQNTQITT